MHADSEQMVVIQCEGAMILSMHASCMNTSLIDQCVEHASAFKLVHIMHISTRSAQQARCVEIDSSKRAKTLMVDLLHAAVMLQG
jgi:hypothetical protein